MNHGYTEQIRDRIISAPDGSVFVNSDFADIADNNTIRQSISRLVREGILRRVIRGVFDKPKYSKLLGEYVAADPDAGCQSTGEMLSLDDRSMWRYRIKYAGAVYPGNGSMVLYQ